MPVMARRRLDGLDPWLPRHADSVMNEPRWTEDDPHRSPHVKEALGGRYDFPCNPTRALGRAEHSFQIAFPDVVAGGMKSTAAAEKPHKRVEAIFTKYQIKA